jgi:hypothetical protein
MKDVQAGAELKADRLHENFKRARSKPPKWTFFWADSSCRDRALLVLGSNKAKQAALKALLDPSTHFRPPLTHTTVELGGTELGTLPPLSLGGIIDNQNSDFVMP